MTAMRRLVWNAASFVLGCLALALLALMIPLYGPLLAAGVLATGAYFARNRALARPADPATGDLEVAA
jgi:hypothetical protein